LSRIGSVKKTVRLADTNKWLATVLVLLVLPCLGCPEDPPDSSFRCTMGDGGVAASPTPVYLLFADQRTTIPNGRSCNRSVSPDPFVCAFPLNGDPASCSRQIQGFLDRWFAPYNVYFTLSPPANGPFDTVVITNSSGWCGSRNRGETLLTCGHRSNDAAFALACNDNPRDCAVLIAHEYGHLLGLAHTNSSTDIMNPTPCTKCDGFRNADISVPEQECGREKQNSNQLLCERLGAHTGAPEPPSAFHCADQAPPTLKVLAPREGETLSTVYVKAEAADECGVRLVSAKAGDSEEKVFGPPYEPSLYLPEGPAAVVVTALDNTGRSTSVTVHVQIVHPSRDAAGQD
jgi:hypothetical protein